MARSNKAVGDYSPAEDTPRIGIVHDPLNGYNYAREHDFGPVGDGHTAESVMAYMQAHPNNVFPFSIIPRGAPVTNEGFGGAYIKQGAE